MSMSRLEVSSVGKRFGQQVVLENVSFSLSAGESLALIGRSGSGKSTLLKCLNLLEMPDCGAMALDGDTYVEDQQALFELWEIRRSIGMVFQNYNLFPNLTVLQNISLALIQNEGYSAKTAKEKSRSVAGALDIASILHRYPSEISGGQAQRCALARAIVLEPKVLLLDEITSALDPLTILEVIEAIEAIRAIDSSTSLSIVFVTHLMQFAEAFADRIAFLHEGNLHEILPAKEFFSSAAKPETREFIDATLRTAQAGPAIS